MHLKLTKHGRFCEQKRPTPYQTLMFGICSEDPKISVKFQFLKYSFGSISDDVPHKLFHLIGNCRQEGQSFEVY